jgi:hypothetical protein
MRTIITLAAALAVLAVAGCGSGGSSSSSGAASTSTPAAKDSSPPGDIPDNQAFVAYRPPGASFTVKVPEGWARVASAGAVTFTDKLNSIAIESRPTGSAVGAAQARRAELPKLARDVKGFSHPRVSVVSRHAGKAVLIRYLAQATPNEVTGRTGTDAVERYLFFHNGREVVLTLTGPKGADNVDPWRIVTDSLRWSA